MPVLETRASSARFVEDDEMFGSGFNHLPAAAESVGDEKCVAALESPGHTVVADQMNEPRDNMAKLITARERSPLSWRTGPRAGQHFTLGIAKKDTALMVWVTLDHAAR